MTHHDPSAREQLTAASRLRDLSLRSTVLLTAGATILWGILAVAVVDDWILLPSAARWLAWLVLAGAATFGVSRFLRQRRRSTSLKDAALALEESIPDAGCEVSTAAEYLSGQRMPTREYESELVAALERRAATVLQQTPVPYARRLWPFALGAALGLLGVVGIWLGLPGGGTALLRTLTPWSSAAFSQVEVLPGSVDLPVGQELTLTNVFRGRIPSRATLSWREEGQSDWFHISLLRTPDGSFRHTFPNVQRSLQYRVAGSDALSPEYRVTAYVPPAVQSLKLGVTPPDYTGLKASEYTSPDLSVVRGSTARFQILATTRLKTARLHFTNDSVVELRETAGGGWTTEIPVPKDATFRMELTDLAGHLSTDRTWHTLTAIPDLAPKVEILEPGGDLRSAGTNTIPLKIAASDDFGLADMRVVFHRLGDPERTVTLKPQWITNHEARAEYALNLAELNLSDYQIVAYHAEASDNNTYDGPGIGRSPVYFIEINHLETTPSPQKPGKPGEKVNLLMVQKQIIADTTALAAQPVTAQAAEFAELASRQADAQALGKIYEAALAQQGAPFAAQGEIHQALAAMSEASAKLQERQRDGALSQEETALASLYRVLQHMPQLKDLPLVPPPTPPENPEKKPTPLAVVLEAIRKRNQAEPNQAEFARALTEMQALLAQQSKLSTACVNPGEAPVEGQSGATPALSRPTSDQSKANSQSKSKSKSSTPGAGSGQGQAQGKSAPAPSSHLPGKTTAQNPGKSEPGKGADAESKSEPSEKQDLAAMKGPGKGQSKGKGKGEANGQGQEKEPVDEAKLEPNEPQPNSDLAKLAPEQERLSQEAKALADRLARLAGKTSRQAAKAGKQMGEAAGKLAVAAKSMKGGDRAGAGSASDQGSAAMGSAIASLERMLRGKPELGDVVAEEAPAQYEGAISEYFRRLSHAQ